MLNPEDFAKVDRTSMMEHDLCGQCPKLNLCGFALCKSMDLTPTLAAIGRYIDFLWVTV